MEPDTEYVQWLLDEQDAEVLHRCENAIPAIIDLRATDGRLRVLVSQREAIRSLLQSNQLMSAPVLDEMLSRVDSSAICRLQAMRRWPLYSDGVAHREARQRALRALRNMNQNTLRQKIHEIGSWHLQELRGKGSADLVVDLIAPLSIKAILIVLGLPTEDWRLVRRCSNGIIRSIEIEPAAETIVNGDDCWAQLEQYLLDAGVEASRTSEVISLILGGTETVVGFLGCTAIAAVSHRPDWAESPDTEKIAAFCLEVLRYYSPAKLTSRAVAIDTLDLLGKTLKNGTIVSLWLQFANWDSEFTEPHIFNCDRPNNASHIAFGSGIHGCVGAFLANIEATVLAALLLPSSVQITGVAWRPSTVMRVPESIVVSF